MRIMAVDNEPLVLSSLVRQLTKVVPEAEIISFTKPAEVFDYLSENIVDIAFLDIQMGSMNGIELAKKCKDLCPRVNIIFVTGHSQYTEGAFSLHGSGYLRKPVLEEALRREIENLRNPLQPVASSRVRIQTFGNFEIFVDAEPLQFPQSKCKECLAYLIDRKGAGVRVAEISAVLWEGEPIVRRFQNSTKKIISDMMRTLKTAGVKDIVIKKFNSIAIDVTKVDCDYYKAIHGDMQQMNAFVGEYMSQYSWAQFSLSELSASSTNFIRNFQIFS